MALGAARWATPTYCSASCTDCAKVSMGKGGVEGVHPFEASRAMKGVSAHIKVTDGAGVPGARMVTDGARVRMDIATNKEQSQDKDTSKGSPVNGQPSEKTVRDNVGDLLVEPLGRSVLPFRPIPIGEGTAPPRCGGRTLVQFPPVSLLVSNLRGLWLMA